MFDSLSDLNSIPAGGADQSGPKIDGIVLVAVKGVRAEVGDVGLTSALAATLTSPASSHGLTSRLALPRKLQRLDLKGGRPVAFFHQLGEWDSPPGRKGLMKTDEVTDARWLDDELLDSLVAGLKVK